VDPDLALERAQRDLFWIPPDARGVVRPELTYVSCPRPVPYLNQVTGTDAPDAALGALVDEVVAAHRGRPSKWLVYDRIATPALHGQLSAADYEPEARYVGYTHAADDLRSADFDVIDVSTPRALRHAQAVADEAFAIHSLLTDDEIAGQLSAARRRRCRRFVAYDGEGTPIATGGLNVYTDLGLGLLWGGAVVSNARGRGAYRAVLAARMSCARQLGLTRVGLFARQDSSAPIVARLGFSAHAPMVYWSSERA
jgi:N-acetylglutamate synthase-like GNAT family acetyltransferase